MGDPGILLKNVVTELRIDERNASKGKRGAGISVGDEGAEGSATGMGDDMVDVSERMREGGKDE